MGRDADDGVARAFEDVLTRLRVEGWEEDELDALLRIRLKRSSSHPARGVGDSCYDAALVTRHLPPHLACERFASSVAPEAVGDSLLSVSYGPALWGGFPPSLLEELRASVLPLVDMLTVTLIQRNATGMVVSRPVRPYATRHIPENLRAAHEACRVTGQPMRMETPTWDAFHDVAWGQRAYWPLVLNALFGNVDARIHACIKLSEVGGYALRSEFSRWLTTEDPNADVRKWAGRCT